MQPCIFCDIVNGKVPSYGVYEDELILAFLDTAPVSKGHCLIIPKQHYQDIFETPDTVLERMNTVAKEISLLAKQKLQATGVNILNASGVSAQQSVFHLHYHLVPRYDEDTLNLWFHQEATPNADIGDVFAAYLAQ